jgi:hypothetical protein
MNERMEGDLARASASLVGTREENFCDHKKTELLK